MENPELPRKLNVKEFDNLVCEIAAKLDGLSIQKAIDVLRRCEEFIEYFTIFSNESIVRGRENIAKWAIEFRSKNPPT